MKLQEVIKYTKDSNFTACLGYLWSIRQLTSSFLDLRFRVLTLRRSFTNGHMHAFSYIFTFLSVFKSMRFGEYTVAKQNLYRHIFEIFKNTPSNCRPQFSDFFSKTSATLLSTDSHIKYIVCICVSFLYVCLTSETLHYPWIPSFCLR